MSRDKFQARADHALADIQPPNEHGSIKWERYKLSLQEFPVPDLVLFALTRMRNLMALGRGEKVAWSIDACFRNTPFQIALRKFGFQLLLPKGTPQELRLRLVGCLQTAAQLAAGSLKENVEQQVDAGNVSIDNQYRVFNGAYVFFRQQATERYSTSQSGMFALLDPALAEAGYCAGAMLNAYFSRLEHVLVLALPFTNFDPSNGALRGFALNRLQDKLKAIFNLSKDGTAKRIHDVLGQVKNTFRDPISHGGFDKRGTAFFFHVPGLAALPALLTDHKVSVERYVTHITQTEFETLCRQLDDCDTLLDQSTIGPGIQYARTGLSVSFSTRFREACRNAAASPAALEGFIDQQLEIADINENMDY